MLLTGFFMSVGVQSKFDFLFVMDSYVKNTVKI